LGTCDGESLPTVPVATDADGVVGPSRGGAKPPGTARILLLGGNVPEGFGVPQDETMARLLELYADERRGDRLEVVNAATGGWAIDNGLAFFRRHGPARAPDLVLLALDPMADVVSISPAHLAALGRRVPAKPFFSLVDGRVEPTRPFALAPTPPAPPPGPLAWSALYRLLRGVPAHVGEPMAWAASGTFPHGTPDEERARSLELARALLRTFRDEVAAAGGRLAVVVMPLPGAVTREATGRAEREGLTTIAGELGLPLLDLSLRLHALELSGRLYLPDSLRLSPTGHALAAGETWSFLRAEGLLPPGVVAARAPGSGRRVPALASLPRVVREALWGSRHWLVGRFIQLGLLAVCVVWIAAPLPGAVRDWVLVGLGVSMLAILGSREAAIVGTGLAVAWYGAVELLPRVPATLVSLLLLAGLVGAAVWLSATPPHEPWAVSVFLTLAANVALLKLIAYAVDRRRGSPRQPLQEFLAGMGFFPTLAAGPVQTPAAFAAGRAMDAGMPPAATVLGGLGRVALGWLEFTLPPLFLTLDNSDVFATGGEVFGRARLWMFVGEVAALFTLLLAGWSNIAIGLGQLVGAPPPENLRRPWLAPSVAAFWRRWHASLSDWWRAYVYLPMGGGRRAAARNVGVVFLVSAVWHGWALANILGWGGFPLRTGARVLLCALLNAGGVIAAHALGAGGARRAGAAATVAGVVATAVFVALAWLPIVLPQTNALRDLGAVYLRLVGVR
jgi:hypothetical protein